MKQILRFAAILAGLTVSATAQTLVTSSAVSAATPLTVLSGGGYSVKDIFFVNGNSTNSGTVKFYDSISNKTNIVLAATTTYSTYTTNYNVVSTNAAGLLITNTFSGIYTAGTVASAATNELTAVFGPALITANGNRLFSGVNLAPAKGLTIYSTVAGTVEIAYERTGE